MKLFSDFENTSDSFPDTLAVNSSEPTRRDGTAITADVLNDLWGFFQALLFESDQTPNTDGEYAERETGGVSGSQAVRAVRALGGAPGEIVYFAGSIDGDGLPDTTMTPTRLMVMAGQIIPIASYPHLVTATYIGMDNNNNTDYTGFYKCNSAGERTILGTYFKIPDCRGMFVRGLDSGRGFDVGRTEDDTQDVVSDVQLSSVGQHIHDVKDKAESLNPTFALWYYNPTYLNTVSGGTRTDSYNFYVPWPSVTSFETEVASGYTDAGQNEIRPTNIAFHTMIRY